MKDFSGKIAVVTGGGSGIGRALVQALTAEGCSVAMCDIREADMLETVRLAEKTAVQGVRISTFVADVAQEKETLAFRDHTGEQHETDHVHLLFNNAGIGGGGSMINTPRAEWDRTFAVCWFGVYYNARAFLPMLLKAPEAHMINVSSVNGFWASLGPQTSHTAYSAAKFAVKGFTEALINDFRNNAPHVKASVVMPGHIGTNIAINSILAYAPAERQQEE
ncbi:MAG: SDR family oxidoreductase, partial [Phenylobacterium sp.]